MAYDLYTGATDDEQAKVAYCMALFASARQHRVNFESQWEEAAALYWPEYRNSFSFGHVRSPGVKYTQYQVDSTSPIAATRFAAVNNALLTPHNMLWSKMEPTGPDADYLMKQREARLYYDQLTRALWDLRYDVNSGFLTEQQTNCHAMGVFGNIGMWVEERDSRPLSGNGLSYSAMGPGEWYILVNRQGRVDGGIRHFRWTARQAFQRWGSKVPPALMAALEKADVYTLFDFLQFVIPRHDYDSQAIFSGQGKPWASITIARVGYNILEEGGYYTFPAPHGRYMVAPEEWYGRGPAQTVLPESKTKNSEKEAFLKQGRQAGDPTYLLPDDGMFDFKAESGAFNYGGMVDGKPQVGVLPVGNIQITKELMQDSDRNINAAFLVDLFPELFDTAKGNVQRSAREVMEVADKRGMFLAPTLGRQLGEYLPALTQREYDIADRLNLLPDPPPVVKEAKASARARLIGPLARALNQQGITGFLRTAEMSAQVAQQTGDPAHTDWIDDAAWPEIATEQYTPERWVASPKKIEAKRQAREQAAERDRQSKELPGRAAIMKAQAIISKAATGGNIGGTLSGTPQGGMPEVPGNPQGTPGQPAMMPGQPGQSGRPG